MNARATFIREGDLQTGEARTLCIHGIGFGDTLVFLDSANNVKRVREPNGAVKTVPSWQVQQVLQDLDLVELEVE